MIAQNKATKAKVNYNSSLQNFVLNIYKNILTTSSSNYTLSPNLREQIQGHGANIARRNAAAEVVRAELLAAQAEAQRTEEAAAAAVQEANAARRAAEAAAAEAAQHRNNARRQQA